MFAIGDCRNFPTCRRVDRPLPTGALFGEEEEWTCEWFLSEAKTAVLLVLVHSLETVNCQKVAQVKTGLINWLLLFFFRWRRNSCADSLRGQYARMGPLQYFFLCGLLYTQTDGKCMNTSNNLMLGLKLSLSSHLVYFLKHYAVTWSGFDPWSAQCKCNKKETEYWYPTWWTVDLLFFLDSCLKS